MYAAAREAECDVPTASVLELSLLTHSQQYQLANMAKRTLMVRMRVVNEESFVTADATRGSTAMVPVDVFYTMTIDRDIRI